MQAPPRTHPPPPPLPPPRGAPPRTHPTHPDLVLAVEVLHARARFRPQQVLLHKAEHRRSMRREGGTQITVRWIPRPQDHTRDADADAEGLRRQLPAGELREP